MKAFKYFTLASESSIFHQCREESQSDETFSSSKFDNLANCEMENQSMVHIHSTVIVSNNIYIFHLIIYGEIRAYLLLFQCGYLL